MSRAIIIHYKGADKPREPFVFINLHSQLTCDFDKLRAWALIHGRSPAGWKMAAGLREPPIPDGGVHHSAPTGGAEIGHRHHDDVKAVPTRVSGPRKVGSLTAPEDSGLQISH